MLYSDIAARFRRPPTLTEHGAPMTTSSPIAPRVLISRLPDLLDDTRLSAALQTASGAAWCGAVNDVDKILATLEAVAAR
jgi:hypothetical protein